MEQIFKIIIFYLFISLFSNFSNSQILLEENFDYPAGDSLRAHGWFPTNSTPSPVKVTSPGLIFSGYQLSNIGNATTIFHSGQCVYKDLPNIENTGSIYVSFMVKIISAQWFGDHIISFYSPDNTIYDYGRIYARDSSGLRFGVSKNEFTAGKIHWTSETYNYGQTYYIVLKYKFKPGTRDDEVSVYIYSTEIPLFEPIIPTIGPATSTNLDIIISRITLSQGNLYNAPKAQIDGIRVSKNWIGPTAIRTDLKVLMEGMYVPGENKLSRIDSLTLYLRESISPFAVKDSATNTIDSISNSGMFVFNNASSGNYYLVTKHFNTIETWSKPGGEYLYDDDTTRIYDFTTSNSQAYGNNQKLVGSKYCIYSGDIYKDGEINLVDLLIIHNDVKNFLTGSYIPSDLNADSNIDLSDINLCYNNSVNFVSVINP